jgi:hypothetical protein
MGQRQNANTRDVQIKSSKEDYASRQKREGVCRREWNVLMR